MTLERLWEQAENVELEASPATSEAFIVNIKNFTVTGHVNNVDNLRLEVDVPSAGRICSNPTRHVSSPRSGW